MAHTVRSSLSAAALLAVLIAACAGTGLPPKAALPPSARAALDTELSAIVHDATRPLASLSAVAVRGGEVVYEGHFGQRSIELGLPADGRTLYRVASISKLVTSLGFMKLVEQGRIDLDADASRALGFELRNPAHPSQVITARMLLSHTASLRDPQDLLGFQVGQRLASVLGPAAATTGASFWATAPGQSPDQRFFTYANVNHVVLATMIEAVTHERFDRYMQRVVFEPLGIEAGYYPAEAFAAEDSARLATLYRKSLDGGRTWNAAGAWIAQGPDRTGVLPMPMPMAGLAAYEAGDNAGIFGPQGSLRVTARGLTRLMQLLMNQGRLDGVALLQPATVAQMTTPQWTYREAEGVASGDTEDGLFFAWGLGLQLFTDRGGTPALGDRIGSAAGGFKGAGHLGDAYGLLSGLVFDPVSKHGMVYLIGGVGADPQQYPGAYSALHGWEEATLRALYQRAVLRADR